jgi:hypothetical protein
MEPMQRICTVFLATAAVVAGGVVHGMWTDRWYTGEETGAVASRLERISDEFGEWQGEPLEQESKPPKGVAGNYTRRFVNRGNGESVTVAIVGGRPGPVSIHTPDACYGASGYEVATQVRHRMPHEGDEPEVELWTAQFLRQRASERTQLRIFWAWSTDGNWQAPDNPRVAFARQPVLYKLYLVREMNVPDQPLSPDDPCLVLMRQLGAELRKALFEEP